MSIIEQLKVLELRIEDMVTEVLRETFIKFVRFDRYNYTKIVD